MSSCLGALARKYPELRIELQTDVRPSRLSKREADILIRLTRPTQGDYTIRRIGQVALGLYGTKQYLEYYGEPQLFTQLTGHRLIGWNKELGYLPLAYWLEDEIDTQQVQLRTANLASQLIAASSHQGLAVLPRFAAEKAGLRRVLCDESWLKMDIWMLQQTASRQLARVPVVSDFLTEVIQAARLQLDSPQ